jgi:hypothetical protein
MLRVHDILRSAAVCPDDTLFNVQLPELPHLLSSLNEKTEGSRNRAGITIFAAWLKICYVIVIHEQ